STRILAAHPEAFIGLEALTGIRERTRRRTRRAPRQTAHPRVQEGTACQSAREQVGLCGTAGVPRVQGRPGRQPVPQSGCRLHQSGLSAVRLYEARQPAPAWSALCLPAVPLQDTGVQSTRTSVLQPYSSVKQRAGGELTRDLRRCPLVL